MSILPNINLLSSDFEYSDLFIIGISETLLTNRVHNNLVSIKGFNLVTLDKMPLKRGGGLLLYI